ncbi:helix-turn-helix domain-containing protein [Saccharopolyspora sp. 5N708]|uniref:helix-turn-helix domain-containing protein n=1 Tax=Saccharopolyspora sp. 5N708 TaxID=3457424 RepID=UPI003FD322A7
MTASRPVTEQERERVRELHAQGKTRNAIAKIMGRSPGTISTIARELGLAFDRSATAAASAAKAADNKARRVEIAHPATAWAAELVDADSSISTGTARLTAQYVPNVRPSRAWRAVPQLAPLGRSDFDGIEGVLDALDETYSSWMRDIRLAKARLIVPESYLENNGPGQGASFDDDRELFTPVNTLGRADSDNGITANQFAIRVAEHRDSAQDLIRTALRTAGYSPATFGDQDGGAPVTATEIAARERISERTRNKKARYWAAGLARITAALLDVDQAVFRSPGSGGELPTVEFPDRAQPDPEALARTAQSLYAPKPPRPRYGSAWSIPTGTTPR